MNCSIKIVISAIALFVASCVEQPHFASFDEGRVVAVVDGVRLRSSDVRSAIPSNVSGTDSVAFVELYVDRWIKHQLKLREAERLFSSSIAEIEEMVESYRNSLLTQKLDHYYINTTTKSPFSESDVKLYYDQNGGFFKLNKAIVKGSILRMPIDEEYRTSITTMMKSRSSETRTNLISMCNKSLDMSFDDFRSQWIDYAEFVSRLPIVKGDSDLYLTRKGVQSISDDSYIYLFEIEEYRAAGRVAPYERAEAQIKMLLTKEFHSEIIREREEALIRKAVDDDIVKRYLKK